MERLVPFSKTNPDCRILHQGGSESEKDSYPKIGTANFKFIMDFETAISLLYGTGWERLIRSHSSARFCFELSGNSN